MTPFFHVFFFPKRRENVLFLIIFWDYSSSRSCCHEEICFVIEEEVRMRYKCKNIWLIYYEFVEYPNPNSFSHLGVLLFNVGIFNFDSLPIKLTKIIRNPCRAYYVHILVLTFLCFLCFFF